MYRFLGQIGISEIAEIEGCERPLLAEGSPSELASRSGLSDRYREKQTSQMVQNAA